MSRRLPLAAAAALAVLAATLAPLGVGTASAAAPGGVTLPAPAGGSVTVNSTTDLVNQTVHVSWKGFKPSSATVVTTSTMYVVRIYQCRGSKPTSPKDCYGSSVYSYPGQTDKTQVLPDGPSNHRDAATDKDGTGSLDMEVRTALESSTLGCTATTACSLAIVPNYGNPKDHSVDFIDATNSAMDSPWAWANHVAVPLTMAPSGDTCPLGVPGVTALGSPMLQREITSWQPTACTQTPAVRIDYTALGEPAARARYLTNTGPTVGLTSLPSSAADGGRPTAYAPLSVSGITVAFHVDDDTTGQPISDLKLNARLVAKLITESYGGVGYVAPGEPLDNANPATAGNPYSIYVDPEFVALNPGHTWPQHNGTNPLLVSGNTDLVWELTRWIQADPDARAWLDGTPDKYGMHVNTNFKGIQYPTESLETRDPYPALTYTFVPVNGLDHVARALVADTPSSSSPIPDVTGVHPKDPQQLPGARGLLAIIDTADAAAFSMPTAALRNAAGAYVQPTAASMGAELPHMAVDPRTGTRSADMTSTDAAAYPLTMVQYAMVPTGDLSTDDAGEVAQFLDYAGGPGQVSGPKTGQLPAGYLPLTPELTAQLTAATAAVRAQSGKPVPPATTPSTSASTDSTTTPTSPAYTTPGSAGSDATPVSGATSLPAATEGAGAPANVTAQASVNRYSGTPGTSGLIRLLLPGLLVLSLLAGLGGPVLLSSGGIRGLVSRITGAVRS